MISSVSNAYIIQDNCNSIHGRKSRIKSIEGHKDYIRCDFQGRDHYVAAKKRLRSSFPE